MASRRRRSRLDGGSSGTPYSFRPVRPAIALTGRPPWRSRSLDLPRSLAIASFAQVSQRPLWPPLGVLRSRRDRTTARAVHRSSVRPMVSRVVSYRAPPPHAKPALNRRSTVCDRRDVRAQVLFAARVAGSRWGRGGPNMRGARRTVLSNYKCG